MKERFLSSQPVWVINDIRIYLPGFRLVFPFQRNNGTVYNGEIGMSGHLLFVFLHWLIPLISIIAITAIISPSMALRLR